MPPQANSPASSKLFDPSRHEALTRMPWNESAARAAIKRIVDDAVQAFSPEGLWPAHELDEPPTPEVRYSMLYLGAGGVIWALRCLAQLGLVREGTRQFDATVTTLVQRNREVGDTHLGGTNSYLLGDAGLLLLQWQVFRESAVADRLFAVVADNLHHPAREMLWGSPGTMLAAVHMAQATSDPRWADLCERGARILWDEMTFDDALGAWVWHQDLYGRTRCYVGAAHGFAGNVYPVLRGAALLPEPLVRGIIERALQTLSALALHADACVNWHPVHDPAAVAGTLPLVQDCHGAPGIVCRLASAPRTEQWDDLLAAAGELTWRAGPLTKGAGLCHGTAGNGFAFLKLWTRTGDPKWLARARAFAMHAIEHVERERRVRGHGRYSLWTGDVGVALYLWGCISAESNFPTLDLAFE